MPESLEELAARAERNPLVVLRLNVSEWNALRESRRGVGEFTTAFPHADFAQLKAPTLCLLMAEVDDEHYAYLGLIGARSAITTLQSRVKVKRAVPIKPADPPALIELLTTPGHKRALTERLSRGSGLTVLSPKLSSELVNRLAQVEGNAGPMRALAAAFSTPRHFRGNAALQDDAIRQPFQSRAAGAIVGALMIGLINNGLILMGLEYSEQLIARGAIIILAVALSQQTCRG